MSDSPTKRSLKYYRNRGYACQVVEYWNAFAKRRIDLFGCIDILAVGNGETIGIQTTSATNHAHRRTKMRGLPIFPIWLAAGNRLVVQSWKKKHGEWVPRTEELTNDHP